MSAPRPAAPPAEIDVCICTFRRTSLADTLASLDAQVGAPPFRIIVADNDDHPGAKAVIAAARTRGQAVTYVHAPARNISIARNACLAAATAPFIAWIDDDERAPSDWLAGLRRALDRAGADAVFGPVRAVYPPCAPAWAVRADLHSTRAVETASGVATGYTSNALVRRAAMGDLQFDPALGRSGGEDTDLFWRMHARGARLAAASDAPVTEEVDPTRLTLAWLARRAFRSGQSHGLRFVGSPARRAAAVPPAAVKAAACLALAAFGAADPAAWRRQLVRAALHAGVVSRLLGLREGILYG
ncbi:glycosyltransferase family 2 protein [Brevundimonas sp.]|uniref:glycosyltransferase family 2 protein n=1 Tax=Brevundimonas sp. TaxID=1871086 RepID=UPI0035B378B7